MCGSGRRAGRRSSCERRRSSAPIAIPMTATSAADIPSHARILDRRRRRATRRRLGLLRILRDRGDESIALARQRLDELRMVGRITQRLAQVIHRLVQAVIEIHERAGGPQPARQFFTRDQFARLLEERQQQLQRLVAQRRSPSGVASVRRSARRRRTPQSGRRGRIVQSGSHRFHHRGTFQSLSPGGNEHSTAREHAGN